MSRLAASLVTAPTGARAKASAALRAVVEAVVLLLVCLSPWAFAGAHEVYLLAGVALLLVLWAAAMLVDWEVSWQRCPVALCLAGLFFLGAWQLVPLPRDGLGWLSPPTARLYHRLLPAEPEIVVAREQGPVPATRAGVTLSLDPDATHRMLLRVAAVFLLFAVVRNQVASPASFRRLSWACLVNGVCLAVFALIQFFSSPPTLLYWTYPTRGGPVFGPFICRNHFPFYLNMCIGLGVGLLLAARATGSRSGRKDPAGAGEGEQPESGESDEAAGRRRRWRRGGAGEGGPHALGPLGWLSSFLDTPTLLWISAALALMVSSVLFSLSRGGVVALLGGVLACALAKVWCSPQPARHGQAAWIAGLLAVGMALALLTWFGCERVEQRLATLGQWQALEESRLPPWRKAWALIQEYPIWGTGLGTFATVEPLATTSPQEVHLLQEHAHNEYLEALTEGGVFRLVLSGLAIILIFRLGYRAFGRQGDRPEGCLVLGALLGFTTVVLHSVVDFGLHIPGIAVLATVLAAQLSATASSTGTPGGPDSDRYAFRSGGLVPLLGASIALVLALMLVGEGRRVARVERLRLTAATLQGQDPAGTIGLRIACLEAAVLVAPQNAALHVQLGDTYLEKDEMSRRPGKNRAVARFVVDLAGAQVTRGGPAVTLTAVATGLLRTTRRDDGSVPRPDWVAAMHHFVRARDCCPLLSIPHLRLAANAGQFARADPATTYCGRAQFVEPADPELWYVGGVQELADGRPDQALASWRHCLALSDRHLQSILGESLGRFPAQRVAEELLPDRPDILVAAAGVLDAQGDYERERRVILDRALALLAQRADPPVAADLHIRALAHQALGQHGQARAAFQAALAQDPKQASWRYEFAQLLYQQGQLREARRQLATVLTQQPAHPQARKRFEDISREIAEGVDKTPR